jgi:hypothetical protein
MNDLLFFVISGAVIALSYYLGFNSGVNKNVKDEVRKFLYDMTVSKMAHDHFMSKAKNQAMNFLYVMGEKKPKIKKPKLQTPEEFDKNN